MKLQCASPVFFSSDLNNSNPMLDPDTEAAARVREACAEVAFDGMELRNGSGRLFFSYSLGLPNRTAGLCYHPQGRG